MGLKKLIKDLWRLRDKRKEYYIDWNIRFVVDDSYFIFMLLPTIEIVPWIYRYVDEPIISIAWLNFGVTIGTFKRKKEK